MKEQITAHGRIIEAARGTRSVRSCAQVAGISEARWRQVVKGIQRQGGMDIPVRTTPKTLAAMARAVGADVTAVLVAAGMEPDAAPATLEPNPAEGATNAQLLTALAARLGVRPEELMGNAMHPAPIETYRKALQEAARHVVEADGFDNPQGMLDALDGAIDEADRAWQRATRE